MKTSELTDPALDWAVAKASQPVYSDIALVAAVRGGYDGIGNFHEPFKPSTNWAQGGPIIEPHITKIEDYGDCWGAEGVDAPEHFGPTPLIAAMRCYCCAKLGDEIDIPEELCQQQSS